MQGHIQHTFQPNNGQCGNFKTLKIFLAEKFIGQNNILQKPVYKFQVFTVNVYFEK